MEFDNQKFKRGVIFSSIVIGLFLLYCISEMIVSWCVDYSYYILDGRIVSAISLFVVAIVYFTQYKQLSVYPALICVVLFFAILIDFFIYRPTDVFLVWIANVNNIKIFPFIIHFSKYQDSVHYSADIQDAPLNYMEFNSITIIFAVALLLGAIVLITALLVKKSKIDTNKANVVLRRITLGMTICLFVEFMRCMLMLASLH